MRHRRLKGWTLCFLFMTDSMFFDCCNDLLYIRWGVLLLKKSKYSSFCKKMRFVLYPCIYLQDWERLQLSVWFIRTTVRLSCKSAGSSADLQWHRSEIPTCDCCMPRKHKALNQCWITVGPPSATLAQQWTSIGWICGCIYPNPH